MTPEQFTYWLQGFAEMQGTRPTDTQWNMIKDHLQLVFKKVTPTYPGSNIPNLNPAPFYIQPHDDPFNPYKNKVMCSMAPSGGSGVIGTIHHTYDKPHYGAGGKGGGGC